MDWKTLLFGRPLRSEEDQVEEIGPLSAVPVLGLDALSSAAYSPEAALTILLPLGILAPDYIGPILGLIILVLAAVCISYRQIIPAYPQGGGSFTVAKENLGCIAGLLAASALCLDYVLNVAVAISAGVGAMVSAVPGLLRYTLALCLIILVLITIANLRGVHSDCYSCSRHISTSVASTLPSSSVPRKSSSRTAIRRQLWNRRTFRPAPAP